MADPTVKLIFSGNAADAERAVVGLEKKVEGLENKLKHLADANKKAMSAKDSDALGSSLDGVASRVMSIAGGAAVIGAALRGAVQESQKFNQELDATWSKLREAETKMRIATGWTPQQAEKAMPALKAAVFQTPALTLPEMISMQTEIAGAGFKEADIESGAAANALLRVRAGMAAFGQDMESPKESSKALAGLLDGMGSDKGAADIERVGMKTAALAAKTSLQFSDLKQLSQASGALAQLGVSESEMLGAFSVTNESGGAMVGSTGLKNIGLRLATADDTQTKALEAIGLKPEDVAISKGGQNLQQAGDKLRAALQGKGEVEKNTFMRQYFGTDTLASAATLFSDAGWQKYGDRKDIADNAQAEMGARIGIFEDSREALNRREILKKEFAQREESLKGQTAGELESAEDARRTKAAVASRPGIGRMLQFGMNFTEGVGDWFNSNIMGETPDSTRQRVRREAGLDPNEGSALEDLMKQQLEEIKSLRRDAANANNKQPLAVQGQRE